MITILKYFKEFIVKSLPPTPLPQTPVPLLRANEYHQFVSETFKGVRKQTQVCIFFSFSFSY